MSVEVSTRTEPAAAAVSEVESVMMLPLIAVMVAPAGMPVPITVRPTTRPVTSARVTVLAPRVPVTTVFKTCSPKVLARKPTVLSRDMPVTGRLVRLPAD